MHAALNGAAGQLRGIGAGFGLEIYTCMHRQRLAMRAMAQAACDDFNKRMYRHCPGVSIGFYGLHQVMPKETLRVNEIVKSAKAQLSERIASPLIGSFVISWCLWNYKFLVILFSAASVSQTFVLVDTIVFPTTWSLILNGVLFPAFTTCAYIFVYPYPAKYVYEFTRRRQKEIELAP